MYMIFNLILAAAVVNLVLGVLALTKGANRLNISFFFLSFLLALWNLFVVLWEGRGISVFARLNFIVITLVPLAAVYFLLALFRVQKGLLSVLPFFILAAALGISGYAVGTFFSETLLGWYDSKACKLTIFIYEFSTLFIIIAAIAYNYRKVKFKQEKMKVAYIVAAFVILYAGSMLELAHTSGLIKQNFRHAGNICNVVYAAIIFYAIFRVRLFNVGVIFRKFAAYAFIAFIAGAVYMSTAVFLASEPVAMGLVYFTLTILLIYYSGLIRGVVYDFADKIAGLPGVEEAKRSCQRITAGQAADDEKISGALELFFKHLEMQAAVFVKAGDYYTLDNQTETGEFKKLIEGSAMPRNMIIRYDTVNKREIELLNRFGADLIMPLVFGGEIIGVLAGKKQTADISFTQDEVEVIADIAASVAVFMKSKVMKLKQAEDENMRRLGVMAGQMAHEIKNPLAALWGAAQLIEGKSDADKENLVIIKEEMQRLTDILDSWRDFSKDLKLDRGQKDAEYLVAGALKLINLQRHKADVHFEKPAEKISVNVDEDKIKQVLLNLILNAIDASDFRDSPLIEISVNKKKRYADIKIRDNGSGIKKENLVKVKEPMFTTKPKGSGLGLAISERIMKAHGGALLLDSDGENFTEVTLSIPLE